MINSKTPHAGNQGTYQSEGLRERRGHGEGPRARGRARARATRATRARGDDSRQPRQHRRSCKAKYTCESELVSATLLQGWRGAQRKGRIGPRMRTNTHGTDKLARTATRAATARMVPVRLEGPPSSPATRGGPVQRRKERQTCHVRDCTHDRGSGRCMRLPCTAIRSRFREPNYMPCLA
jgi:hypothetical protein